MIETERLILRPWRDEDAAAHRELCSDPRVAATLGPPPTIADSHDVVQRQNAFLAQHGYCFWAIEERATGRFAGWCGIKPGKPPLATETEIGWAIAPDLWGQGYAREAATSVLAWTWATTDLPAVAAITVPANTRSWGLMERLGMTRFPDEDFDRPDVPDGSPLKRHILYRVNRPA